MTERGRDRGRRKGRGRRHLKRRVLGRSVDVNTNEMILLRTAVAAAATAAVAASCL